MKCFNKKAVIILSALFLIMPSAVGAEENKKLIPMGQTVGITMELGGVEVVDVGDFTDYDGKTHSPAEDAGVKKGDLILEIDGKEITSANDLKSIVSEGEVSLKIRRNGDIKEVTIKPEISKESGNYCMGVWVKDAISGIGTMTYYNPDNGDFGALGHGICNPVTGEVAEITGGDVMRADVVAVQKGSKGEPGELIGVFADGKEKIGEVEKNDSTGIKGSISTGKIETLNQPLEIATTSDVTEGDAYILSNVDENKVEKFEVKIQKINPDTTSHKNMVIKVTDKNLLDKTGGIVQGMSGSPIIQNGKLVGAVTHVFVNDPTRGYGIFIENMLEEAEKIK